MVVLWVQRAGPHPRLYELRLTHLAGALAAVSCIIRLLSGGLLKVRSHGLLPIKSMLQGSTNRLRCSVHQFPARHGVFLGSEALLQRPASHQGSTYLEGSHAEGLAGLQWTGAEVELLEADHQAAAALSREELGGEPPPIETAGAKRMVVFRLGRMASPTGQRTAMLHDDRQTRLLRRQRRSPGGGHDADPQPTPTCRASASNGRAVKLRRRDAKSPGNPAGP